MIVEHLTGTAAELHQRPLGEGEATLTFCVVTAPALVLGSSQPDDLVDRSLAGQRGVSVVRRRGGGGAVLLEPGAGTWFDIEISPSDRRWNVDVGRAFHWVGEVCRDVFADLGVESEVHTGRMLSSDWSRLVCFAGLGPGEVTVAGGAKLVGISQRRTRERSRFMGLVLERWDPAPIVDLVVDGAVAAARSALVDVGVGFDDVGVARADFEAALTARLEGDDRGTLA